jgi:hypothetical protein
MGMEPSPQPVFPYQRILLPLFTLVRGNGCSQKFAQPRSDALSLRVSAVEQPHYCPCHLRHRDHLGESTLRTRIHRSGGHFVLQSRRQDKRRDAAPRCTVV